MQPGAAPLGDLRQHDAQLAVARGVALRLRAVEGGVEPHRAREAAEVALDEVKARGPRLATVGPFLLAGDDSTPALTRMRTASAGDAGQVEHDLDGVARSRTRRATGMHSPATTCRRSGRRSGQVLEQALDVVGEIAGSIAWEPDENARHVAAFYGRRAWCQVCGCRAILHGIDRSSYETLWPQLRLLI